MKKSEITGMVRAVEPRTYSSLVVVEAKHNGNECWRLWFIKRGCRWDHEDYKPTGRERKDQEAIERIVRHHANEFIDSYAGETS